MASSPDRPRTAPRDVLTQALLAVAGRRGRSALTAAGVALGVAATLSTIGITTTASAAISQRFDATKATQVTIAWPERVARPDPGRGAEAMRLNGVTAAGLFCDTHERGQRIATVGGRIGSEAGSPVGVVAAQPAALEALGITIEAGRGFDSGHGHRRDAVALIDTVAARAVGMTEPGRMIFLDGTPLLVLGIYAAPPGEVRLTSTVVVPYEACYDSGLDSQIFGKTQEAIRVRLGAADQVAREAMIVLWPQEPERLTALVPPDLRTFRRGVESDIAGLLLGLVVVSLAIGALGVSNTTLVSVIERTREIGLRRAIGASRLSVAAQFLVESTIIGLVGGLTGTVVAVNIIAAVCLIKGWVLVFQQAMLIAGPLGGLLVGAVAGLYPAWRATRVEPSVSLRAG
jgi:putative ABC transport system permease protein